MRKEVLLSKNNHYCFYKLWDYCCYRYHKTNPKHNRMSSLTYASYFPIASWNIWTRSIFISKGCLGSSHRNIYLKLVYKWNILLLSIFRNSYKTIKWITHRISKLTIVRQDRMNAKLDLLIPFLPNPFHHNYL